jgi:hypothetical protein
MKIFGLIIPPLEGGLAVVGAALLTAVFKLIDHLNAKREERNKARIETEGHERVAEIEAAKDRHAADVNLELGYLASSERLIAHYERQLIRVAEQYGVERAQWLLEVNTWRAEAERRGRENAECEARCRQLEFDIRELTSRLDEIQRRQDGKGRT